MKILFNITLLLIMGASCLAQTIRVSVNEKSNSLIVKAPPAVQKQIEQLIRDLDSEQQTALNIKVIPLAYTQSSEIAPILQKVMVAFKPIQIKSSQFGLDSSNWDSEIHGIVIPDERTNKIIIMSDKTTINNLEKILKELDKKPTYSSNAFITKLKNANAINLADILTNVSKR
jgi:type II secretory pathway component GspD/PulD (secretin)